MRITPLQLLAGALLGFAALFGLTWSVATADHTGHTVTLEATQTTCDTYDVAATFAAGENDIADWSNKAVLVGGVEVANGEAPPDPIATGVAPDTLVVVQLLRTDDSHLLAAAQLQTGPSTCLPETGSITIIKDTDPETDDASNIRFDFDGDLGDFDLEDDEWFVAEELLPGEYRVQEGELAGYTLKDIECSGGAVDIDDESREVTVTLGAGDAVECTFTNGEVPAPEPSATAVPPTPVVIIVESPPAPTNTPVRTGTITPPDTGSAGLR